MANRRKVGGRLANVFGQLFSVEGDVSWPRVAIGVAILAAIVALLLFGSGCGALTIVGGGDPVTRFARSPRQQWTASATVYEVAMRTLADYRARGDLDEDDVAVVDRWYPLAHAGLEEWRRYVVRGEVAPDDALTDVPSGEPGKAPPPALSDEDLVMRIATRTAIAVDATLRRTGTGVTEEQMGDLWRRCLDAEEAWILAGAARGEARGAGEGGVEYRGARAPRIVDPE
jgi:hypothetical protein